jgi:hypothetical protein
MVSDEAILTEEHVKQITQQMCRILGETFDAALANPIHFQVSLFYFVVYCSFGYNPKQPLPNAFELFGVDFMLTHESSGTDSALEGCPFRVSLLEFNSEPAIEMTSFRLQWIFDDLGAAIGDTCLSPFFSNSGGAQQWPVGDTKNYLIKCFSKKVR